MQKWRKPATVSMSWDVIIAKSSKSAHTFAPLTIVFLFFVIPKTVEVIAALLDELVYRSGAQFIAGAKVLDPGASRLDRRDAEDQHAHGDADFVTAAEAVRRMAGQPEL